jgi:RNA polymerase sigma factor (sigma-70 family)
VGTAYNWSPAGLRPSLPCAMKKSPPGRPDVRRPSGPNSGAETTASLLVRARAGDKAAVDVLFARYLPALRRWTSGRLPRWARDISDTHDLVQETLLQTFKRVETFEARGPGALQAYLRQAVLNGIRNELRRFGRRPAIAELDSNQVADAPSPLEAAIGREAVERYEDALAELKPEDRELVIARIEMGYDYDELADAFDRPTADAARKALQRAMVRLVEAMKRRE